MEVFLVNTAMSGFTNLFLASNPGSAVGWPALTEFTYDQNFEYNIISTAGMAFNDDGTRLYGTTDDGAQSRMVQNVPPWSIGYVPEDETVPISVLVRGSNRLREFAFSSDGTKVFAAFLGLDTIEEITNAGPAFNPEVGDLAVTVDSFAVTPDNPRSLDMKPDGLRLWYVTNNAGRDIFEVDLTVADDLTTASMGNSFAPAEGDMLCMKFSPDGKKFFTIGLDRNLYEYDVATLWDITTATYSGNFININANAPVGADAIGFDLSPTGNHLVCLYQHVGDANNSETAHYTSAGI